MAQKLYGDRSMVFMKDDYVYKKLKIDMDMEDATSLVSDMVALSNGQLVIADTANLKLKVTSKCASRVSHAVNLTDVPHLLAVLADGKVAVTFPHRLIVFLDVRYPALIRKRISTSKEYKLGMVAGPDDTLIMCGKDEGCSHAFVDMIRRDGSLVMNIVKPDNPQLTLENPGFMCVVGEHLLIPDSISHCVYKIQMSTGQVVGTVYDNLPGPTQVISNSAGSLFIHYMTFGRWLEYTPSSQWRIYALDKKDPNPTPPFIRKLLPIESGFAVLFVNNTDVITDCMVRIYKEVLTS